MHLTQGLHLRVFPDLRLSALSLLPGHTPPRKTSAARRERPPRGATSKFYDWGPLRPGERAQRLGAARLLAGSVGETVILDLHDRHPLEGYRRLTFMMLDADVAAVSPASVGRIVPQAADLCL